MLKKTNSTMEKTKKGIKVRLLSHVETFDEAFDDAFEDGLYVIPREKNAPRHNLRAIDKYCEEHGIDPSELTDEQLKQFEIHR